MRAIWNQPRPTLRARAWEGNEFLITRFNRSKTPEGPPFYFTSQLSDDHLLSPDAVAIPTWLGEQNTSGLDQESLLDGESYIQRTANLSHPAKDYLGALGRPDPDQDMGNARRIWYHALGIGYSPGSLGENDAGSA